jgi:hypothetical protein
VGQFEEGNYTAGNLLPCMRKPIPDIRGWPRWWRGETRDGVSSSHYRPVASCNRIGESWIGKDVDGNSHGIIWGTIPALCPGKPRSFGGILRFEEGFYVGSPISVYLYHFFPQSAHSSTLKMEESCSFRTLGNIYQTTRCHIPENSSHFSHNYWCPSRDFNQAPPEQQCLSRPPQWWL